jgi:hypothetical protein
MHVPCVYISARWSCERRRIWTDEHGSCYTGWMPKAVMSNSLRCCRRSGRAKGVQLSIIVGGIRCPISDDASVYYGSTTKKTHSSSHQTRSWGRGPRVLGPGPGVGELPALQGPGCAALHALWRPKAAGCSASAWCSRQGSVDGPALALARGASMPHVALASLSAPARLCSMDSRASGEWRRYSPPWLAALAADGWPATATISPGSQARCDFALVTPVQSTALLSSSQRPHACFCLTTA